MNLNVWGQMKFILHLNKNLRPQEHRKEHVCKQVTTNLQALAYIICKISELDDFERIKIINYNANVYYLLRNTERMQAAIKKKVHPNARRPTLLQIDAKNNTNDV